MLQRGSAESGWVFDGRRVFSCVADIVRFDTVRVGVHVGLDSGRQRAEKVAGMYRSKLAAAGKVHTKHRMLACLYESS